MQLKCNALVLNEIPEYLKYNTSVGDIAPIDPVTETLGKNQDFNPQTLLHKFRLMGSAFDGTLNQSVSETHEAESGGSDMDSYKL